MIYYIAVAWLAVIAYFFLGFMLGAIWMLQSEERDRKKRRMG